MNSTTITGNLIREPEIRYTREGRACTQLGVAVSRHFEIDGEPAEETDYFEVVAWDTMAENIALSFAKGMRVVVVGELRRRSWETDDGGEGSRVEITAADVGASLLHATVDVMKVERRDATSY